MAKKIIIVIFSNRKQKVTYNLGFVVKNIVNVALLKKVRIIIRVYLANFYWFSSKPTTNTIVLLTTINLPHQQVWKILSNFFCL